MDRALAKASARALTIDQERRGAPAMRPRLEHVIEAYPNAATAQERNDLLKSVVSRITYEKNAAERSAGDATIYIQIERRFE